MMQTRPVFHIFIPSLLTPLNNWYQDFAFEVTAPSLSTLLLRYTSETNDDISSIYASYFQHKKQNELPIAYYRQQLHFDKIHNNLICADPIYLEVGMNDVVLTDRITDLTDSEAKELLDLFNQHFEQDGLHFLFGSNRHWYVTVGENESVYSLDIDTVFLQNIVDKLTHSKQRNWKVIQNEVQMLLHSSDVNKHREIAGLKPVNSLWFWGAGQAVKPIFNATKIVSRDIPSSQITGQIFAKVEQCEWLKLPQHGAQLMALNDNSSNQVVILDQLLILALENKLDEFQETLTSIDKRYIQPLLEAWKRNEIDIVIDSCDGQRIHPIRVPKWKFWLKPQNLRKVAK